MSAWIKDDLTLHFDGFEPRVSFNFGAHDFMAAVESLKRRVFPANRCYDEEVKRWTVKLNRFTLPELDALFGNFKAKLRAMLQQYAGQGTLFEEKIELDVAWTEVRDWCQPSPPKRDMDSTEATIEAMRRVGAEETDEGEIECPKCGGIIHFHIFGPRSGWGQCETQGCVSWRS